MRLERPEPRPEKLNSKSSSWVGEGRRGCWKREKPREWQKWEKKERRWLKEVAMRAKKRIGIESDETSFSCP